jgi:hypothetical protein
MKAKDGKNQMKKEKRQKIGIRMNKILGEIRDDFLKCSLAKNLTKDRIGKLL